MANNYWKLSSFTDIDSLLQLVKKSYSSAANKSPCNRPCIVSTGFHHISHTIVTYKYNSSCCRFRSLLGRCPLWKVQKECQQSRRRFITLGRFYSDVCRRYEPILDRIQIVEHLHDQFNSNALGFYLMESLFGNRLRHFFTLLSSLNSEQLSASISRIIANHPSH
jgi:hypothetical protein